MMAKAKPQFDKETDLCAAFLEAVEIHNKTVESSKNPHYNAHIWTPYCETAGWDILLVSKHDGTQVGIEAKLKLNVNVLCQAINGRYGQGWSAGPDFRAILVPSYQVQTGVGTLATKLGVTVLRQQQLGVDVSEWNRNNSFTPELPRIYPHSWYFDHWTDWLPNNRERLPEYVPDVIAGDKAPLQLSEWKIQALKLAIVLEERPLTHSDFNDLKISPSRWTQQWLMRTAQGFVAGPLTPDFASQHPSIYEKIKQDKDNWMPGPKPLARAMGHK
jgi:hypothetical protein